MTEEMVQLIKENKDMLEEFSEAFWDGPDVTLTRIKEEYINPDEAFLIGYMTGIHAKELIENDE